MHLLPYTCDHSVSSFLIYAHALLKMPLIVDMLKYIEWNLEREKKRERLYWMLSGCFLTTGRELQPNKDEMLFLNVCWNYGFRKPGIHRKLQESLNYVWEMHRKFAYNISHKIASWLTIQATTLSTQESLLVACTTITAPCKPILRQS